MSLVTRLIPFCALAAGIAISPVAAQPQELIFRTGVDLVTVDATVLGQDGRPDGSFTADDFILKVDGQPRAIASAQFVSQPASRSVQPLLPSRHFTSNENADAGRMVVVAVDEAHIRRTEGRAALEAASNFIDRLDPLDRIAIAPLSRLGNLQFTRDRVGVKRALEGLTGQTDPVFLQFKLGLAEAIEVADGSRGKLAELVLRECGRSLSEYSSPARAIDDAVERGRDACPEQLEQEARAMSQYARTMARVSLSALEALVSSLKSIDGPKTVVLLSEGMVLDPRLVDVSELAAQSKESRVAIYALHMETPMFEAAQDRISPTFLRDIQLRGDGLERVAGATRGAVFRLAGSDPRPFDRIATELSGYYLLAFEATERERDGKVHRVEVALKRGGGLLRSRSAFKLMPIAPSATNRQEELVTLLRGTRAATELPLRVATYTYAEPDNRLRVVVSTETDVEDDGPYAQVLLGYVLTDAKGVIVASGAQLAVAGRQAFSSVLAPGAYNLRVAGTDAFGRRGMVERPFAAAIAGAGAIGFSDLILAPVPATPDAALHPLVDRISMSRVTANVELYGRTVGALRDLQVFVDVSREGERAAPRVSTPATLKQGDTDMVVARANLSLGDLPAGTYLAYARIVAGGKEVARVTRPFTYAP